LRFVSSFPASAGRSGLQLFTLALLAEDQGQAIKITLTPFFPTAAGEEWKKEEVTLIKQVSEFKLAYFDLLDGSSEGNWEEEWLDRETLPRLVKVSIKLENGLFWPEMIIDLKINGITDESYFEAEDTDVGDDPETDPDPGTTE
jgi:general secretion pathway protein J